MQESDIEEKLGLSDVIVWRTKDGLTTITTCDGPHRVAIIYCGTVRWKGLTEDQCKPDLLKWIDKQVNEYNKQVLAEEEEDVKGIKVARDGIH